MTPGATLLLLFRNGAAPPQTNPDLESAIIAALAASSSLSTAFGHSTGTPKYFADLAEADTDLPCLVYTDGEEDAEYESEDLADDLTPYTDAGEITIAIYAAGEAEALDLGDQVQAVLFDAPLIFDDGTLLYIRRTHRSSDIDPDKGPNGEDVWQCTLIFKTIVARTD